MTFAETFTLSFWILLGLALLVSSIGFYKFLYFISLGYGFSVAVTGIAMLVLFWDSLSIVTALMCIMFVIYGCRLGGYLLLREMKQSYREHMKKEINDGSSMPFFCKGVHLGFLCTVICAGGVPGAVPHE